MKLNNIFILAANVIGFGALAYGLIKSSHVLSAVQRSPAELAEISEWNRRLAGIDPDNPSTWQSAPDYLNHLAWKYYATEPNIAVDPVNARRMGAYAFYKPETKTIFLGNDLLTNARDVQTVWDEFTHHTNPNMPHREQ